MASSSSTKRKAAVAELDDIKSKRGSVRHLCIVIIEDSLHSRVTFVPEGQELVPSDFDALWGKVRALEPAEFYKYTTLNGVIMTDGAREQSAEWKSMCRLMYMRFVDDTLVCSPTSPLDTDFEVANMDDTDPDDRRLSKDILERTKDIWDWHNVSDPKTGGKLWYVPQQLQENMAALLQVSNQQTELMRDLDRTLTTFLTTQNDLMRRMGDKK